MCHVASGYATIALVISVSQESQDVLQSSEALTPETSQLKQSVKPQEFLNVRAFKFLNKKLFVHIQQLNTTFCPQTCETKPWVSMAEKHMYMHLSKIPSHSTLYKTSCSEKVLSYAKDR